jgi:hypothetical protein
MTKEGEPHVYRPLKAIRRKCLDCYGADQVAVRQLQIYLLPPSPVSHGEESEQEGNWGQPPPAK